MDEYWLLNKLSDTRDQSDPLYAFLGSANWMRALAIKSASLVDDRMAAQQFYSQKVKSRCSLDADVQALESHYKALHCLATVKSIASSRDTYDLILPAIVSWYYALYFASQAFLWARSGQAPHTHAGTAKLLQHHVILKDLFIEPFNMNVPTIVEKESEDHMSTNYPCERFELINEPITSKDAQSALVAYLRGTAKYRQEMVKQELRKTPEFKSLQVDNFRTTKARTLRDARFRKQHVNILVEAFRYRGKANYRDGLYLSYGEDYVDKMRRWAEDMHFVARAFMVMVTTYLVYSAPSKLWKEYCSDIKIHTRFNLDEELLIQ